MNWQELVDEINKTPADFEYLRVGMEPKEPHLLPIMYPSRGEILRVTLHEGLLGVHLRYLATYDSITNRWLYRREPRSDGKPSIIMDQDVAGMLPGIWSRNQEEEAQWDIALIFMRRLFGSLSYNLLNPEDQTPIQSDSNLPEDETTSELIPHVMVSGSWLCRKSSPVCAPLDINKIHRL